MQIPRVFTVLLPLLTGCAGVYPQPKTSSPHADILLIREKVDRFQAGGLQQFLVYDNAGCTSDKGEVLENLSFVTQDEKHARLPINDRIYIKAATLGFWHGLHRCEGHKLCVVNNTCVNLTSFIPEQGKSYAIRQAITSDSCSIDLLDKTTNAPPESMIAHDVTGKCIP